MSIVAIKPKCNRNAYTIFASFSIFQLVLRSGNNDMVCARVSTPLFSKRRSKSRKKSKKQNAHIGSSHRFVSEFCCIADFASQFERAISIKLLAKSMNAPQQQHSKVDNTILP